MPPHRVQGSSQAAACVDFQLTSTCIAVALCSLSSGAKHKAVRGSGRPALTNPAAHLRCVVPAGNFHLDPRIADKPKTDSKPRKTRAPKSQ
ncbi:hypothetical protein BR93DRAFT_629748 [Coniochaeta sp. PMI_546]|nr:hypothetical protein BR93DRAFT_629748 [Coniochaeta sp. PMI_546]